MSPDRSPAEAVADPAPRKDSPDTTALLALRLAAANARLNALALVTAVALIVLGLWVYAGVKQSLREIRAAGLQTVLEAEVQAFRLWAEEKRANAEQWANDEEVRRAVAQLAALGRSAASADGPLQAEARARLAAALAPALKEGGVVAYNVIDPAGRILATTVEEHIGRRLNPGSFLARLTAVFAGSTRFMRPYPERERVSGATANGPGRPAVWIEVPVRGAQAEVAAALGFGYHADAQFASIFSVARPGRSGEVYAFDERGLMLTESRFVAELKKAGVLPAAPEASAMLQVEVRDPGGDLAAGHRPDLELAARPFTRLAALAIASRGRSADERSGVVLDPYRSYRGVASVGAWRWLEDYDMGVAIEMSAEEAYAPLAYLNLAFALILGLLLTAVAAVLWSSLYVKRLRREVGDIRVVGQYRLERELGEGGMARVYLARHALLRRPTALKMLKPHLASDEIVARFEREVQLASQLVHPNTIEIYDYGRTREGLFYYVMEYLEGETLDRLVAAHGPLPVGRTIHVLRQVCAALREAHGRGLVHRDIKPHNIMLCQRGGEHDVVKLLDFGLVKDVEGRQSRDITQFQKFLGTPLYMSPERIRNPGDADARSDIYSVGAVGFHLLTAADLFEAGSDHDLTYHVLHTPPRRPSALAPGIPRRLDELIVRCLAKERTERPHDVLVVMALLEALSVEYPWTQREAEAWWRRRRENAAPGAPPAAA